MGPTRISVRATWTNSCGVNPKARRRNLRTLTFSNTWLKCTLAGRHEVYVYIKRSFSGPPLPMKENELDHGCLITHINNVIRNIRFLYLIDTPCACFKFSQSRASLILCCLSVDYYRVPVTK